MAQPGTVQSSPSTTERERTSHDEPANTNGGTNNPSDVEKPSIAGVGGSEGAETHPFGPKPTNFFELLAAAVSKARMEQSKGPGFLNYLKTSGVKTAWTRAIVALYEEQKKPDDPLSYILTLMGLGIPEVDTVKMMQEVIQTLRGKAFHLQGENEHLKQLIAEEQERLRKLRELANSNIDGLISEYNSDEDYDPEGDKKGTCD